MTKPKKFHDPYRYQHHLVDRSPFGNVKEYYKEKSTPRMHTLSEQSQKLLSEQQREWDSVRAKYNPADEFGLNAAAQRVLSKYLPAQKCISGEFIADFLIANNIARRNKPLHADTAIKILKKMQKRTGSIRAAVYQDEIQRCKITDLSFPKEREHNLAYFLYHKYNVLLMNTETYNCIQRQKAIHERYLDGSHDAWWKKWQRYNNLSKKFHQSVINEEYQK